MKIPPALLLFNPRWLRVFLLIGLSTSLAANPSADQSRPPQTRAIITPSLVKLQEGQTQQFKIVLLPTRLMPSSNPRTVKWAVNAIEGGNAELGTIDADGLYRAPLKAPTPHEIHVSGYHEEAQNRLLYATVVLGDVTPRYKSVGLWTQKLHGDEPPLIKSPHGIGMDREGNILIADQDAGRVFRFAVDGAYLNEIGDGPGDNPGQFAEPREVRSNAKGDILVTDNKGDRPRLQFFDHQGKLLKIFAEKGRGPGQILRAHGIGFDPQQRIFIPDVDNMRVNVYDKTGKFLYDFSNWGAYQGMNAGEMNAPHGMFVDQNGDAFVNSYYGPTYKFTPEGHIIGSFAYGDPPEGSVFFHNVTGDRWGNVYVTVRPADAGQNRISSSRAISVKKYNNQGDFITEWSFTDPKHRETNCVVDDRGLVYALFVTQTHMGVEIFAQD